MEPEKTFEPVPGIRTDEEVDAIIEKQTNTAPSVATTAGSAETKVQWWKCTIFVSGKEYKTWGCMSSDIARQAAAAVAEKDDTVRFPRRQVANEDTEPLKGETKKYVFGDVEHTATARYPATIESAGEAKTETETVRDKVYLFIPLVRINYAPYHSVAIPYNHVVKEKDPNKIPAAFKIGDAVRVLDGSGIPRYGRGGWSSWYHGPWINHKGIVESVTYFRIKGEPENNHYCYRLKGCRGMIGDQRGLVPYREIHFYAKRPKRTRIITTIDETVQAMVKNKTIIRTTQIALASTKLITKGYAVFFHPADEGTEEKKVRLDFSTVYSSPSTEPDKEAVLKTLQETDNLKQLIMQGKFGPVVS